MEIPGISQRADDELGFEYGNSQDRRRKKGRVRFPDQQWHRTGVMTPQSLLPGRVFLKGCIPLNGVVFYNWSSCRIAISFLCFSPIIALSSVPSRLPSRSTKKEVRLDIECSGISKHKSIKYYSVRQY